MGEPSDLRRLLLQIGEDWKTGERSLKPGTQAVIVHRLGRWFATLPAPLDGLLKPLYRVLYKYVRTVHGIQLPLSAEVGRRVRIVHSGGIWIGEGARIGDDCLLRHGVTLGARRRSIEPDAPTLENGVQVSPGAIILGAITIGAGSRIGPNAVVLDDVPPHSRVLPQPVDVRPRFRKEAQAEGPGDVSAG